MGGLLRVRLIYCTLATGCGGFHRIQPPEVETPKCQRVDIGNSSGLGEGCLRTELRTADQPRVTKGNPELYRRSQRLSSGGTGLPCSFMDRASRNLGLSICLEILANSCILSGFIGPL